MQITFLGTSCAKPTKDRNHSAFFLKYGSDGILFDCGEGTQRQLTIAGIKPSQIKIILISHWHGDHVLGLLGLIQTMGMSDYDKTLRIYGPKGTKEHFAHMLKSTIFEQRIKIEIKEGMGKIIDVTDYKIEADYLEHLTPIIGFRFVEKNKRRINIRYIKKHNIPEGPLLGKLQQGKAILWQGKNITPSKATYEVKGKILSYLPDSIPTKNSLKLAQDADVLVCESTYTTKLQEKAEEYMHMTARQAASIANQANVKKLILTHFSTRYKDIHKLEEDAKEIFNNIVVANDFMKVKI